MQGPVTPVVQERGLKGADERGKFLNRQACQIQHLGGRGGEIAIPSPALSLLSWRAQYHPKSKS
jgi:hypothetical protein